MNRSTLAQTILSTEVRSHPEPDATDSWAGYLVAHAAYLRRPGDFTERPALTAFNRFLMQFLPDDAEGRRHAAATMAATFRRERGDRP